MAAWELIPVSCGINLVVDESGIDVGLVVGNLEQSLAFYTNILGLDISGRMHLPRVGKIIFLRAGCSAIKLIQRESEPGVSVVRGGLRGNAAGLRYLTVHVKDLAGLVARCDAAGHKVAMRPKIFAASVTIAAIEDPEGNWIELQHQS
ncbi:MAG: VOC family protein [Gammaproteobacteria bacterium]|nr:VOC family protein [Gammaproteobacteria bacterium]